MMNSLSILGHLAKDLVSKAYEFDSKKHKLKPGDNLVVTGRGKPKMVMNQQEYVEHRLNRHKQEFREGAHKRGYINPRIHPDHNPQFANMLRREIKTGKVTGTSGGSWSDYGQASRRKKSKTPYHDVRELSRQGAYKTRLSDSNHKMLSSYNNSSGVKPKGKDKVLDNFHGPAVRGVHYGGKPATDTKYKIYYTQQIVENEIKKPLRDLNVEKLRLLDQKELWQSGRATPKNQATFNQKLKKIEQEEKMLMRKLKPLQKYVDDLPGSNGHKLDYRA